jgi:hypothetical protein
MKADEDGPFACTIRIAPVANLDETKRASNLGFNFVAMIQQSFQTSGSRSLRQEPCGTIHFGQIHSGFLEFAQDSRSD